MNNFILAFFQSIWHEEAEEMKTLRECQKKGQEKGGHWWLMIVEMICQKHTHTPTRCWNRAYVWLTDGELYGSQRICCIQIKSTRSFLFWRWLSNLRNFVSFSSSFWFSQRFIHGQNILCQFTMTRLTQLTRSHCWNVPHSIQKL